MNLVPAPDASRAAAAAKRRRRKEAQPNAVCKGLLTESLGSAVVVPRATRRDGWPSASEPIWPRRSNPTAPTTASFVKPRSPTGSKAGQPGQTKRSAVLTSSRPTASTLSRFAPVEAMMAPDMKQGFPAFVSGMLAGTEKLDDMLQRVYRATREEFINYSGEWVAQRYGQLQ